MEELFQLFDGHLNRQGYIARGGQILDASIVPVPRNHNTRDENAAIKKGEVPEGWTDKPAKRVQKDVEARWTKKARQEPLWLQKPCECGSKAQAGTALSRQRCRCA